MLLYNASGPLDVPLLILILKSNYMYRAVYMKKGSALQEISWPANGWYFMFATKGTESLW